ncbi:interferon-induced protein 44-like [Sphaeramia orbicularis]|uniref:Interferon-induced protein 44-like n=1 Tax=Sphaeramia orbicularis TaxID=375764 RepID=A0A673AP92_9TELE|nr:interferon-induced protein 44-like [Sphaeramia orbicularis]
MGGNSSSEPEPCPTFDQPWRKIDWGSKEENLRFATEYQPLKDDIKHLRILLYGPVGAGKSSFINSISTALTSRMVLTAAVNANNKAKSFTNQYTTHKILKGRGVYCSFICNDIMGLEDGEDVGVRAEDIKLAMEGHVEDGYKFNPASSLSKDDNKYRPCPTPDEKVHVLVCVLNANALEIKPSVIQKMKAIRETARDMGIPQLAIATQIDEACPEIQKDLKNVYKSKHLREKMCFLSSNVGIPLNCIFAVKNYSDGDNNCDDNMDTLILTALRSMLNVGDDFINAM